MMVDGKGKQIEPAKNPIEQCDKELYTVKELMENMYGQFDDDVFQPYIVFTNDAMRLYFEFGREREVYNRVLFWNALFLKIKRKEAKREGQRFTKENMYNYAIRLCNFDQNMLQASAERDYNGYVSRFMELEQKCPVCGTGTLRIKGGGSFLGCSNYNTEKNDGIGFRCFYMRGLNKYSLD